MEGDGFQGASVVGAERARGVVEHYTEVCRASLVYARREESVVAYAAYFLCGEQTLEEVELVNLSVPVVFVVLMSSNAETALASLESVGGLQSRMRSPSM